jgi:hypothetical protein
MKTLFIFFALTASMYSQMRDSTWTEYEQASSSSVTLSYTAAETAIIHRALGENWKRDIQVFVLTYAKQRDPQKTETWNVVNGLSLTASQKKQVYDALGLRDPREVPVTKSKEVPVLVSPVPR